MLPPLGVRPLSSRANIVRWYIVVLKRNFSVSLWTSLRSSGKYDSTTVHSSAILSVLSKPISKTRAFLSVCHWKSYCFSSPGLSFTLIKIYYCTSGRHVLFFTLVPGNVSRYGQYRTPAWVY